MATQETTDKLVSLASEIIEREVATVVRNSDWGTYNFEECRDDLESAYSVIRLLPELNLESLLEDMTQGIISHLTTLRDSINAVTEFTIQQDAAEQNRNQLAKVLSNASKTAWQQVAPWIGYLYFQTADVTTSLKKIAETGGHVDDALKDFLEKRDEAQDQIGAAIRAAKEVAGKAGVGHFADDFSDEADDRLTGANWWLGATIVFAAATAFAAYKIGNVSQLPTDLGPLLQYTTMRAIILGLLFTGTIWCGGQFKTNKHQQSVNKHRANALKTFQAFVGATNDPAVQDAVLMETTRSIFAITPSGYLGGSKSGPDAGSKIVEIVKSAPKITAEDQ